MSLNARPGHSVGSVSTKPEQNCICICVYILYTYMHMSIECKTPLYDVCKCACIFIRVCSGGTVCTKVRGWPSVYITAFHLVWDGGQGVLSVSGDLPVSTFQLYSSNGTTDTCYGVWLCVDSGAMNSGPRDCNANNLTHWAKFLVCPLLKSFLAQSLPLLGFMCQAFI